MRPIVDTINYTAYLSGMVHLRLVALDEDVAFPNMPVTVSAAVGKDTRVLLIPKRGSGYAKVGVVADVVERQKVRGLSVVAFMPLQRALPGAAQTGPDGVLRVEVEERPDGVKLAATFVELEPETRAAVKQYAADMAFLKKELRSATEKQR